MKSVKYRPDIDGLRTLAVLMVILYHIGVQKISGGFIGVDVFLLFLDISSLESYILNYKTGPLAMKTFICEG
ncbi:TPA: hypothetical protein JLC67_002393 [Escherichia coli]|nr:hypothetical protein [Escherichia coli]